MQAAHYDTYGTPDVLTVSEAPRPDIGPGDILVEVRASPVTQGDRRLRAADFPGISALPGRLMMGVLGPRNTRPGTMFAGRVVEVGADVTRFAIGDDVFGSVGSDAHAEYLAVPQDGPVATMPDGLGYDEAAAIPYGAVTAMTFLQRIARLRVGERILILGASGGVGRYAVPLARHLGAEVTGVCSRSNGALVRSLGAHHVVYHDEVDPLARGRQYDVILDIPGVSSFSDAKHSLSATGRYVSLIASLDVVLAMAWTALKGGRRALTGVALGDQADLEAVRDLAEAGVFRPNIDRRFALADIAAAHAWLESGQARGDVVVLIGDDAPTLELAV